MRGVSVDGSTVQIKADFNTTSTVEIIGIPAGVSKLQINGKDTQYTTNDQGSWLTDGGYSKPSLDIPDLTSLDWKYINSLPETDADYDDSKWVDADHTTTNNPVAPLLTPTSLYGSDYGYNTGSLLLRGHFESSDGSEKSLALWTQGGQAFGFSAWLDSTFLGSWTGIDADSDNNSTFTLPNLTPGKSYVLTILIDNMGLDEDWTVGSDQMKEPRGVLNYSFSSGTESVATSVTWKITGNLGGEDYEDRVRGPLNEGGLFIERQGYHQPSPPVDEFSTGSPYDGITSAGVAYYTAKLTLDLPSDEYDIPLSFTFVNNTAVSGTYRALLFVNGYQFGRYTSNIGPQTDFPVPEGILNYQGDNWVGLTVWALDSGGAKVPGFSLTAGVPILTSREQVKLVEVPAWKQREGVY